MPGTPVGAGDRTEDGVDKHVSSVAYLLVGGETDG